MFKLGALRIHTPQGLITCDDGWNLYEHGEVEEVIYSHKSFWNVFEMVKLKQELHEEVSPLLFSIILLYGDDDCVELWSNFVYSVSGDPMENMEVALKILFESKSFDHEEPNHPDIYEIAVEETNKN